MKFSFTLWTTSFYVTALRKVKYLYTISSKSVFYVLLYTLVNLNINNVNKGRRRGGGSAPWAPFLAMCLIHIVISRQKFNTIDPLSPRVMRFSSKSWRLLLSNLVRSLQPPASPFVVVLQLRKFIHYIHRRNNILKQINRA